LSLDESTLAALKHTIHALDTKSQQAVPADIIQALSKVARPGLRLHIDVEASQQIGAPLVTIREENNKSRMLAKLTKRQTEVAELVIDGHSNRIIASKLGISTATVKDHVHAILACLDMASRAQLIAASHSVSEQ